MLLYPAIDIRGGRAVRLVRGDYDRETAFDDDPLEAARRWLAQGARALHVVDLDGARAGHQANLDHARRIAAEAVVPVQLGGGLRDAESVAEAIDAGVARVVLGTAALEDPARRSSRSTASGSWSRPMRARARWRWRVGSARPRSVWST